MTEGYPTPEAPVQEEGKKKSNTTLIVIIIVVVALLLCCCVLVVVGPMFGLTLLGPEIGNVFSDIVETLEAPVP
jgi:flagellar basal body-associated protein FliL